MPADKSCIVDGCDKPSRAKQMCRYHYNKSRSANRQNYSKEDYDVAVRLVDLVLIVSDAHTKINQAIIVASNPETKFGVTVLDLLIDAETLLRSTWRYGTTEER